MIHGTSKQSPFMRFISNRVNVISLPDTQKKSIGNVSYLAYERNESTDKWTRRVVREYLFSPVGICKQVFTNHLHAPRYDCLTLVNLTEFLASVDESRSFGLKQIVFMPTEMFLYFAEIA